METKTIKERMLEMKKDPGGLRKAPVARGDIAIETSRAEKQRRKRKGTSKEEQNIQELWDNYKSIMYL